MIEIQNIPRYFVIALTCSGMIACASSEDSPITNIILDKPFAERQILAFENSTFRVDIRVNNGPVQSFTIFPGDNTLTASVAGVVLDQNNSIDVKWTELLNGFDVEISDQSQTFFADGNTVIDAMHITDQYDYDNDGASNSEERSAGMCVWSANEVCVTTGQADVPENGVGVAPTSDTVPVVVNVPVVTGDNTGNGITTLEASVNTTILPPSFQFDFANADNVAVNGDFSGGSEPWSTQVANLVADGNDLCSVFPPGTVQRFDNLFYYGILFDLEPGRYAFRFDIRADRDSIATFAVTSPDVLAWLEQGFTVGETSRSIELFYEHRGGSFANSGVAFSAIRHPNVTTTFCVDNFQFFVER